MLAGRYEDALREYEAAFPHYLAHAYQAMVYDGIGEREKALEQARKASEKPDSQFRSRGMLIMTLAKAGKRDEAAREMALLEASHEYISQFEWAIANMGFGDYDSVLRHLEAASVEREYLMLFLPFWPMFRSIHGDQRFLRIVRAMSLPEPK
jgi:tetratricopeptide (TPR) repeat protein